MTCPHRRVIDAEWPRASRAGHAHHGAPFFLIAPEKTIQPVQGWLPVHLQDSGERGEKRGPRAPRHVARSEALRFGHRRHVRARAAIPPPCRSRASCRSKFGAPFHWPPSRCPSRPGSEALDRGPPWRRSRVPSGRRSVRHRRPAARQFDNHRRWPAGRRLAGGRLPLRVGGGGSRRWVARRRRDDLRRPIVIVAQDRAIARARHRGISREKHRDGHVRDSTASAARLARRTCTSTVHRLACSASCRSSPAGPQGRGAHVRRRSRPGSARDSFRWRMPASQTPC